MKSIDIKDDMELYLARNNLFIIGPTWKHFITVSAEL